MVVFEVVRVLVCVSWSCFVSGYVCVLRVSAFACVVVYVSGLP